MKNVFDSVEIATIERALCAEALRCADKHREVRAAFISASSDPSASRDALDEAEAKFDASKERESARVKHIIRLMKDFGASPRYVSIAKNLLSDIEN